MRHFVAGLILIASSYSIILAQQKDKPSLTPTPSILPSVLVSDEASKIPFNQSQDQSTKQMSLFVVRNGAVYLSLMGDKSLVGMPGGAASGCFSLDLSQRIAGLNEFTRRLESLKQGDLQPH